jgi:hypothetical protein
MWRSIAIIALTAVRFVGGPALAGTPDPDAAKACIDVQIGNDRSAYFACLNDAFQKKAQHEHATPPAEVPVDAHSSPTEVGTFNESAARQQMGNAFGVTSVPQRPKPVFVSPLVPPTTH